MMPAVQELQAGQCDVHVARRSRCMSGASVCRVLYTCLTSVKYSSQLSEFCITKFAASTSQVYLTYEKVLGGALRHAVGETGPQQQSDDDAWLLAIVERVVAGQESGDEQSAVSFDRALATGGVHISQFSTCGCGSLMAQIQCSGLIERVSPMSMQVRPAARRQRGA